MMPDFARVVGRKFFGILDFGNGFVLAIGARGPPGVLPEPHEVGQRPVQVPLQRRLLAAQRRTLLAGVE